MRNSIKTQRPKDQKRVLLRLWKALRVHPWMIAAAIAFTLAGNALALVGPMLSGRAIDAIGARAGAVDFPVVFRCCALMTALYAASSGLSYMLSVLMIHLSRKVVFQMRRDVFNHLVELPVRYFDSHSTGGIISHLSYDIDTVNASLSNDLLQIATSAITVAGSLGMMLLLSPPLVLVFAVTIPVSLVFTRLRTRKVRPLFHSRSVRLGELNGFAEEALSGQKTVKAYHQEETMIGRFEEKNRAAAGAWYQADYTSGTTGPSVNFINNLSLALISVFGALLFLSGRLTLGGLSSFVLYSRKFSGPINEIANIISELQSAFAAAERVFALLDEPAEPPDPPEARPVAGTRGDVVMEGVDFGYAPGKPILHNLTLNAPSGATVAIVGPTGAGKTTLINLLMRFYDPDSGVIRLDGRDIKGITRQSLRRCYAMVLQDTWLFHGTVFDNIAYARRDASPAQVEAAARAAHIHAYIERLPDGYGTLLSENGVILSQGQKQLITIARAMLADSPMLILDEATSNVDTRTELAIQSAMRRLMEGRTCFIIAHRLSTIRNADTILVMRDGTIAEQGGHEELLRKDGIYAALYRAQFQ